MNAAGGTIAGARAAGRYGTGAMLLHWLTAAAFAFQIGLGWRMDAPRTPQTFAVFQLHKSVGITILLLTLLRIAWRLGHRPPPLSPTLTAAERMLARTVHAGLYAILLAMPLTGWLIVSSSRVAVPTYLYATIPWPHVPGVATMAPAARDRVNGAAATAHVWLSWVALAGIALHVAGALKHQLLDGDGEFGRMVRAPQRWLSALALLAVVAFVGLMATGRSVTLAPVAIRGAAEAPQAPSPPSAPVTQAPPTPAPQANAPTVADTAAPAAAAAPPAPTDAAKPSGWIVRPASSSIRFHTGWSQGPVDGGFGKWQATIRFDPAALGEAAATVKVDMASVTAADSEQQGALPEDDWFATTRHPTATWTATRFTHQGGDKYVAAGTLSLRGVTRPLAIPFTLAIVGDVATMTGTAKIDRTVFGVGQGEWLSTADLPALVSLTIAIKADRAAK